MFWNDSVTEGYFLDLFLDDQVCFIVLLLLIIFLDVVWNLGEILVDVKRPHIFFHFAPNSVLFHFFGFLVLHKNYVIQIFLDKIPIILRLFCHLSWVVVFFLAGNHFERPMISVIADPFIFDVRSNLILRIWLHKLHPVIILLAKVTLESGSDLRKFISLPVIAKRRFIVFLSLHLYDTIIYRVISVLYCNSSIWCWSVIMVLLLIQISAMMFGLQCILESVEAFARFYIHFIILTNEVEDIFILRFLKIGIFLERRFLVLKLEIQRL